MVKDSLSRTQKATLVTILAAVIFGVSLVNFQFAADLLTRQTTAIIYLGLSLYMIAAYLCWLGNRWGFALAIVLSLVLGFYNGWTGADLLQREELMAAFLSGFNTIIELLVVVFAYNSTR